MCMLLYTKWIAYQNDRHRWYLMYRMSHRELITLTSRRMYVHPQIVEMTIYWDCRDGRLDCWDGRLGLSDAQLIPLASIFSSCASATSTGRLMDDSFVQFSWAVMMYDWLIIVRLACSTRTKRKLRAFQAARGLRSRHIDGWFVRSVLVCRAGDNVWKSEDCSTLTLRHTVACLPRWKVWLGRGQVQGFEEFLRRLLYLYLSWAFYTLFIPSLQQPTTSVADTRL